MVDLEPVSAGEDSLLEVALDAHAHGLAVVPPREDGTKRPDGPWRDYQRERPTEEQVRAWYANGRAGLGVLTGAVSGNLEMLELEGRAKHLWREFRQRCADEGIGDLLDRIATGYAENTPSGGAHLLYRCDGPVEGNQKLARRLDEITAEIQVLFETRGEGGYVVVAPSHGSVHPSGLPWVLRFGGFARIETITVDERTALLEVARSFDELGPTAPDLPLEERPFAAPRADSWMDATVDAYNRATTWEGVLGAHGWTHSHRHGHTDFWTRPGKDPRHGHSATTNHHGTDRLIVFSSSVGGFEVADGVGPATSYDRFGAMAVLEHGGDRVAAAQAARQQGHGPAWEDAPAAVDLEVLAGGEALVGLVEGLEHGWRVADVGAVLVDGYQPPAPDIFKRIDGAFLLYRGRVNALHGESGSGKSWVAMCAGAQALTAGETVLYIDLEDHLSSVVARFAALGVPTEVIAERLDYIAPEGPYTPQARFAVEQLVVDRGYALVVVDSTGEAMALDAAKQNDDDAVAQWFRRLPRALAALGPAVVIIDHVPKDHDAPKLYAIGSQRKRAAVDGVAYRVEAGVHPAKGRTGRLRLLVAKDRNGAFQAGSRAADVTLESSEDGTTVRIRVALPESVTRPTTLMEKVSRFLELNPDATRNAICKEVQGKTDGIRLAVDRLLTEGNVIAERQGQAVVHRVLVPFRQDDESDLRGLIEGDDDA